MSLQSQRCSFEPDDDAPVAVNRVGNGRIARHLLDAQHLQCRLEVRVARVHLHCQPGLNESGRTCEIAPELSSYAMMDAFEG